MSDIYLAVNGIDTGTAEYRPEFSPLRSERLLREIAMNTEANTSLTAANQANLQLTIDQVILAQEGGVPGMRSSIEDVSRPSGFISGVMAEARASEIYQSQMESDASHNAVVDTINTWTDRALNVAIYQVLKDYPGLASISDASRVMQQR